MVFLPSGRTGKVKFVFTDEQRLLGFSPIGTEAILDAIGMNNVSLWCTSQVLLNHGVLVPRTKLTTNAIEGRINAISSHYPISNSIHAMGVAIHETTTMRGFHIIGDDLNIAAMWANMFNYECNVKGWDVAAKCMCWTAFPPASVYIPYLDLDERDQEGNFDRVWRTRVQPTIAIIHGALKAKVPDAKTVIFFNNRRDKDGLWKYSFHIHWPDVCVDNIMKWKEFLLSLSELPRKVLWTCKQGVWTVRPDDKTPIFDPAVYSGRRQLFRGPFCGKFGQLDATMLPCTLKLVDGVYEFQRKVYAVNEMIVHILSARIAKSPEGLAMLHFGTAITRPLPLTPAAEPEGDLQISALEDVKDCPLTNFVAPIFLNFILPAWQQKRREDLMKSRCRGAAVPEKIVLTKNTKGRKPGERFYAVAGDTFCEMDDAHVHTKNPSVIGVVVDFFKATIRQSCFACGTRGPVYFFLHANNRVGIATEHESQFTGMQYWAPCASPHQFLLDYYSDSFVQQRVTRTLWAYEHESRVWRTDTNGNMVVGGLIDDLNRRHGAYLRMYKAHILDRQIDRLDRTDPEEAKEQEKKLKDQARKFMKDNTPFMAITATTRGKIIDELRSFQIHREVAEMNSFDHLVPMKNGKCINVFTGEVCDMERHHFFTSCVDAEICTEVDDIKEIKALFQEISTGDAEKCLYLKRICGYCFTFLVHDRKMYVLLGSGSNAKGMLKQFVMDISKGPEGFDSRAKNLQQNFWADRGNINVGSESATPESYELQNKTLLYTDDIAPVPMDNNKLKRIVAAEASSGRGLYGKPVDIKVRGKVMWTTNFQPAGPGEDIAYWERLSMIPMLAKYLETGAIDALNFRFRKDHARYLMLLEKKDAFFTIVIRKLIKYYRSLPWDTSRQRPATLPAFPLPRSVRKAVDEARARRFPLAAFVKEYTCKTTDSKEYMKLDDLFPNYITYLDNINELKAKRETTQSQFQELMATSMDMLCVGGIFEGYRMTKQVMATKRSHFDDAPREDSYNPLPHADLPHFPRRPEGFYLDRALPPAQTTTPSEPTPSELTLRPQSPPRLARSMAALQEHLQARGLSFPS